MAKQDYRLQSFRMTLNRNHKMRFLHTACCCNLLSAELTKHQNETETIHHFCNFGSIFDADFYHIVRQEIWFNLIKFNLVYFFPLDTQMDVLRRAMHWNLFVRNSSLMQKLEQEKTLEKLLLL